MSRSRQKASPQDCSLDMEDGPADSGSMSSQQYFPHSFNVSAEISNRAVYREALEKGSGTVHRTRLMIVGQERVGKTSLMRSLIHERNKKESARCTGGITKEGITTDCTINISYASSWHCKKDDSSSLTHELMMGLERESNKHIGMKPLQPTHRFIQASSAASQIETTETQPSGTTRKSLIYDKVIKKAMSKDVEPTVQPTLNIWDFAGQDLYYTMHQTFLSSRAIYLVVFNLSQDLDEPVPVQDKVPYRTTPIQYLDFWMQSIFTYTKENYSQDRLEQNSPPIFIVGTHRNSVGGDDIPDYERKVLINEVFTRIRLEIHNKPYSRYVVSEFYAIENSLEDNMKIEQLRNHIQSIAMKEPYMGERIPLNWLAFDDEKGNISGGKPVTTLKQVMDGFGIEDEAELLTMLKFYHDLGHIIYFGGDGESQALKDVVILDPQWLIDAFKKILTVKPTGKHTVKYRKSWDRLKDEGILEDLLIDHMWQDILEHKQALLDLMDKFDLLCERVDEEEEKSSPASSTATQPCPAKASYYVPSMLRQRTSRSLQLETVEKNKNSSVFYVDFQEFLPDGLFHRLVARALRWSHKVGGRKPDLLYDRARFYVDDHHDFALHMVQQSIRAYIKVSVIRAEVIPPPQNVKPPSADVMCKVSVIRAEVIPPPQNVKPPSADVMCKVKGFVEENLQNLKTMWIKRINYCISVQCPDKKHKDLHFLPLDECMAKPAVVCCFEGSHVVVKTHEIQAMFKQESSEEEASARGDRPHISDINFREIAKDIGGEWEQLASLLGFKNEDVDKIKTDNRGVNEQIFRMLEQWRENRGYKVENLGYKMDKMQKELIKALGKVSKRKVARKWRKY